MAITNGGTKSAPATVTATGTRILLLAENPRRRSALFRNTDTTNSVFIGDVTVTASGSAKGTELKAGESISDSKSRDAWYVITAGSSVDVSVLEIS